ncbi:MAG: alpha/beta fold hydrolase [Candidatus Aminicenantes bacterium]|nr:alpha/beta fold hydrolase [Candidatus Aminicenantes bacterium]
MKNIRNVIIFIMLTLIINSSIALASIRLKLESCYNKELKEEVLCGTYEVMENRHVRKGAKILIHFIILPARTSHPAPDPVFIFDGGPGVGAASYPSAWALYCDRVREKRDIVLVDQRGTGLSHPLPCQRLGDPQSAQTYLQDMFPEDYVKECREKLREKAGLYYYHTVMAMADYDDLRDALGYDQINIMGGSYGSYFGIIFMKMYPERVRSAFLFSIALPHLLYPANLARDTQTALERLFADCAADPDCAGDYPELSARLDRVLTRLQQNPVSVTILNPITEKPEAVSFSHNNFIEGLRSMLYNNSLSKWIPAFIRWADLGVFQPMAEYTADYLYWSNQSVLDGMFLCVTCSETIPYIDFETARAMAEGTMMGTYRLDQQQSACKNWEEADIPPGFHDLVYQNIPTLIVNGENDPTTPPSNAQILSQYQNNSTVVVIPNAGHEIGVVMEGCLDELIACFFDQASVSGLDFSCVYAHTRPPFVSWRDYEGVSVQKIRQDFKNR